MTRENAQIPEQPFSGRDVYFSGSVGGVTESDFEFPEQLVAYMRESGTTILDPQVAISAKKNLMSF